MAEGFCGLFRSVTRNGPAQIWKPADNGKMGGEARRTDRIHIPVSVADRLGLWNVIGGVPHRRRNRAVERRSTEMVNGAAVGVVALGVYRRAAIGGLEFKQRDADAFCGVCGLFLFGVVFVEPDWQNGSFLVWNHLRVPIGARHGFTTTFRRAEGDAPVFFDLHLSANEGSPAGISAEDFERADFWDFVLSECIGRGDFVAAAADRGGAVGIAGPVYARCKSVACGNRGSWRIELLILVRLKGRVAAGIADGVGGAVADEVQEGDQG